jgi:hypothetical protein
MIFFSSRSEKFLFLKEEKWTEVLIHYRTCENGMSIPTVLLVCDPLTLNSLQNSLNVENWEYVPLHISDKWNHIIVKHGDKTTSKFVYGGDGDLCYYASLNNSVFFYNNSCFYNTILNTISKNNKNNKNKISLLSNDPCIIN